MTRLGAYGLIITEGKLLLIEKMGGPFKGLWDLPGGAIEFGESPETALQREIKEEAALSANDFELLTVMHHYDASYPFHHIGIIYRVNKIQSLQDLLPEDPICWVLANEIVLAELTPFAKQAWNHYRI